MRGTTHPSYTRAQRTTVTLLPGWVALREIKMVVKRGAGAAETAPANGRPLLDDRAGGCVHMRAVVSR